MKKIITLVLIAIFATSMVSCKKICYCEVKGTDGGPVYPKVEVGIISEKDCEEFTDAHWNGQGYTYQCYQEK